MTIQTAISCTNHQKTHFGYLLNIDMVWKSNAGCIYERRKNAGK